MTVFLSHAIGAERLPFGATPPPDSAARRRWRALAGLYRDSLAVCGIGVASVLRPEIYQTDLAREVLGARPRDWHLAVKPIEHLRPFHGIPNVWLCDWPHPALSTASAPGAPFLNHVRLLKHADAVACCTDRTTGMLRAAGVDRAVTVPPFVPAPGPGMPARHRGPDAPCMFLAAADNAEVARHAPLLRGFTQARAEHHALRLTVAVEGMDEAFGSRTLAALGIADPDGAISFVPGPPGHAVARFQASTDFFLWDGTPGGLPLAAAEAALAGLPLVAVPSRDLDLPAGCTVAVASTRVPLDEAEEPAARVMPLGWDAATVDGVRDALLVAATLPATVRADMARTCRDAVGRQFGLQAFRGGLDGLMRLLPP